MSMLGADLGDLEALKNQISNTTMGIADAHGSTNRITAQTVVAARDAAKRALNEITGELATLMSQVQRSRAEAARVNWTGNNYVVFDGAVGTFEVAMGRARDMTAETFQAFDAAVDQLAVELEGYVEQFQARLAEASESTVSMHTAVHGQQTNLDTVMNTGLSVN